tara:strand:+ start:95280 stop:96515 length:1236 start_codon:yes stop_codon:yes gene_type:complete
MFFGWRVVAGSFVSMLLIVGFFTYSFTLLVTPIRDAFDASLEQVMYGLTLGTFGGLLVSPITGILVDRYSVRNLMSVGCLIVAGGFWWMAQATSITQFTLVFAATMCLGNSFAGSMPGSAAVSRWFVASRGKALGIATIGTSIGGMVLPALTTWWLETGDWRSTLENFSLVTLLLVTPFVWFNVHGRPHDKGLEPEGGTGANNGSVAETPEGLDMKTIARQPAFWLIAIGIGLLVAVFSSFMANLSPYALGLGKSAVQASSLIMALAIAGLVGKILFGMGADRFSLKLGIALSQGLVAIAFLIFASQPAYPVMLLAAIAMGLATGGLLPVWNAMVAHIFGVQSYGRAMGLMFPITTLLIMPAYALIGRLYDMQGNYTLCLWIYTGVLAVSALLLAPVKMKSLSAEPQVGNR